MDSFLLFIRSIATSMDRQTDSDKRSDISPTESRSSADAGPKFAVINDVITEHGGHTEHGDPVFTEHGGHTEHGDPVANQAAVQYRYHMQNLLNCIIVKHLKFAMT